jgi:AcrR family transcriptional regulator
MLENVTEAKKVDPRIRRTRQLLQQALTELSVEKSFQQITVQDIADRATVNRVTFYAHFEDKYALLEYTMRAMFQQHLRSRLPEGSPLSPESLAALIELVGEMISGIAAHCPPPHGQLETLMEKQIKAGVYEVLHAWLAEMPAGNAQPHPTPEQAATIASWAIYGAAVQWSQNNQHETAKEFAQQVLPLIFASLRPMARV